jgi:hypothetical protein
MWRIKRFLLTSSHQTKLSAKLIPAIRNWSVPVGLGLGGLATGLALYAVHCNYDYRYHFKGACEKSLDSSKDQVVKAFHRQISKPDYKPPQLKRNNIFSRASGSNRILLIEGESGCGKTVAAKEFVYEILNSSKEIYRRGTFYFPLFFPETSNLMELFE